MSTASVSNLPNRPKDEADRLAEPTNDRSAAAVSADRGPVRNVAWPAVGAIWSREVKRFFRQRNRVIGAVATPLVFWLLLGLGLDETFRLSPSAADQETLNAASDVGYLEFFFPGMVILMVLFTAIFSTISVIEDRKEGFLQGVLASPAKRWAIVLGKVLGGASIATAQGVLLLAIWCVFFAWPGIGNLLAAVGVMFVVAVGLTGLGLCIAWPMDSTAGFHAVMNLLLMPMWFLCGAVFPVETAGPMKWIMYANPLTYGNTSFAWALQGDAAVGIGLPNAVALVVTAAATIAVVAGATRLASKAGKA
ncbi:MAG: ABC transporter permease [Planctomycetota bacterium]